MITFPRLGQIGRLGNCMFQIAATIGVAEKYGYGYTFPFWNYAEYFAEPLPQTDPSHTQWRYYRENGFHYQTIPGQAFMALEGYFQSEKYFSHCEEKIRAQFRPRKEVEDQLKDKLSGYFEEKTCSVHVRREDYLRLSNYHPALPLYYYLNAFERIGPDSQYMVFSDDIPWCRENFSPLPYRFIFMEGFPDIHDLFSMSMCNDHIIANSSFSWWGAWLNPDKEKQVISPSKDSWFGNAYHHYIMNDLLPESWIQIPC